MFDIFDGPQIRKMKKGNQFTESMTLLEGTTCDMLITVIDNFLG